MHYMDIVLSVSLQIFILREGATLSHPFTIKNLAKTVARGEEIVEVGQFTNLVCDVVKTIHQPSFMLISSHFSGARGFRDAAPQETLTHGIG